MPDITLEVREFVATKFSSTEQLDVFVFLYQNRERSWTPREVAEAIGSPPEAVGMRLFLLASSGLIKGEGSPDMFYRYEANQLLDLVADKIATLFSSSKQDLYAIVGGKAADPARQLANAFKVRK